jgi:predicted O-methyltransferase YrrM
MAIDPFDEKVKGYLDALVWPRPDELQKMEARARDEDFPIVGPMCGHLCYQIARIAGTRTVFELGSGYGYSTAWFARAVRENGGGRVHHVVWDADLSRQAREHLTALGFADLMEFHVAEAVATLREAGGPFDLIFLDIDKRGYPDALPVIHEKLRPGGVLIADNLLWSGRIFDDNDRSEETEGIREFTRRISQDERWITSVLPVRDGLLVAYRR